MLLLKLKEWTGGMIKAKPPPYNIFFKKKIKILIDPNKNIKIFYLLLEDSGRPMVSWNIVNSYYIFHKLIKKM